MVTGEFNYNIRSLIYQNPSVVLIILLSIAFTVIAFKRWKFIALLLALVFGAVIVEAGNWSAAVALKKLRASDFPIACIRTRNGMPATGGKEICHYRLLMDKRHIYLAEWIGDGKVSPTIIVPLAEIMTMQIRPLPAIMKP